MLLDKHVLFHICSLLTFRDESFLLVNLKDKPYIIHHPKKVECGNPKEPTILNSWNVRPFLRPDFPGTNLPNLSTFWGSTFEPRKQKSNHLTFHWILGGKIGILIVVNYTPHITGVGTFIPHVYTTSFFFHIVHLNVLLVDIATGLNRSTSGMGIFISTRGAGASGCAKVDGWIRDVVGLHRHPLRLDSYKDLESH